MTAKIDIVPIAREHYATLRNNRTGKKSWPDFLVQFGVPVAAGIALGVTGVGFPEMGSLLTLISILAGFSFALAIFIFELRGDLGKKHQRGTRVLMLTDEFFYNVSYAVIIGLIAAVMGAVTTTFDPGTNAKLISESLTVTLSAHFIIVLLMCLKRLNAVYRETTR